jgi:hypothetical protein
VSHLWQFPANSKETVHLLLIYRKPRPTGVNVVQHKAGLGWLYYFGRYRLLKTLLIVLPIVFPPCILLARASSKAD